MAMTGSGHISDDMEDDSNISYPKSSDLSDANDGRIVNEVAGHSVHPYMIHHKSLSSDHKHLIDKDQEDAFYTFQSGGYDGKVFQLQHEAAYRLRAQNNGSTSDDSDSNEIIQRGQYADAKMRVGKDYQVMVNRFVAPAGPRCESPDRAMCVWTPLPADGSVTEEQLNTFVELAHSRYGYTAEQALGLLFWHKHNIELASADLANFTPYPDEWTQEEQLVFEQAFGFQGKHFHKIKQALPDKTVPHLVKYYYQWKKTRTKMSMLERRDQDDSGSEYSDTDMPESKPSWKRNRRPRQRQPSTAGVETRYRRKIPRGMFLDYDAFIAMSMHSDEQNAAILTTLDNQLHTARSQVQRNRADITQKWENLLNEVKAYREPEIEGQISSKWTEEELLLAVQGVRRYGKDFRAIAQLLGNKTEGHVRAFCTNYRSKYNLDEVLAEHKREYVQSEKSKQLEQH